MCGLGEDCGDCGPRTVWAAPPPPPGPPAPLLSHVPLSALLLLAWLFASVCARFIRAQQLRRYREASRPPVAVAVPVFTGIATTAPDVRAEAHHGASGAPSGMEAGSGTEAGAAGGAPQPTRASAATEGAVAVEVSEAAASDSSHLTGGGGDAPTVVVQGRRIDRQML